MNDKYAVVVVTYNRLSLLKECVRCILKQSLEVNQIIIINNASTDGTEDYLKSLDPEKFLVINEKINLGGAGGFYEGISASLKTDNDWILIIDDDAMISQNYIETIKVYSDLHKDIKAFSGTVKTEGKIITDHRRRMITSKGLGEIAVPQSDYYKETFEYDLSTFCGLLVSKDIVESIGLPRLDFFIQYDDTEYCMRIRKLTKIINVNAAALNHKTTMLIENTNHKTKWNWKIYYGTRNKIYSCFKHGYRRVIASYIVRIIGGSIKDYLNPRIPKDVSKYNMQMIFRSVYCGLIGKLGKDNRYLP